MDIKITAHAGCMGTDMDSIESLEVGIKYGAHILEIMEANKEVMLNIDIKDVAVIPKLNKLIYDYNLKERTYYTGINYFQLLKNEELLIGQNYFVNLEPPKLQLTEINNKAYLLDLIQELQRLGIMGINIYYKLATKELIEVCREKGLLSSVWTVDEEEDMKTFIGRKVNSITTKNVEALKRLII